MSMENLYEFNVTVTKVVDGDTIDVDIDLGFSVVLKKQRVRLMGIDTPESRTRDLVEKVFGKASKYHLTDILSRGAVTLISHDKGKFGRILGDFIVDRNGEPTSVVQALQEDGHAVPYFGGSKDETQAQHMINRKRLIDEGVVDMTYELAGIENLTDTESVV